jgi:hypothetical protein
MLLTPVAAAQQHLRHLNLGAPGGPDLPAGWIKVFSPSSPPADAAADLPGVGLPSRHAVDGGAYLLPQLAASLLIERRVAQWSLPGLGLLISWGLWFGAGYGVLHFATGLVAIALVWQTLRCRTEVWPVWAILGLMVATLAAAYLITLLLTGMIQGVILPSQVRLWLDYAPYAVRAGAVYCGSGAAVRAALRSQRRDRQPERDDVADIHHAHC